MYRERALPPLLLLLAVIALVIAPMGTARAADSAPVTPMADSYYTTYSIVNKSVVSTNWTNRSQIVGSCKVSTTGSSCTITSGKSATVTVNASLGATQKWVAGQLGISAGKTITITTSCSSPPLKAGSEYRAAAVGTRYQYKVKKSTHMDGRIVSSTTSGWLYAFNPNPTRIHCGV